MIARLAALLLFLSVAPLHAQGTAEIVYLGVQSDPIYEPSASYTGLSLRDRTRPIDGARIAIQGSRVLQRALGVSFVLQEEMADSPPDIAQLAEAAFARGAIAIVLDVPAGSMESLADIDTKGGLLFNVRQRGDRWRGVDCVAGVLHTIPSDSMLTDAIAQHLKARGWDRVLLLSSASEPDLERAEAARNSIRKFGLSLVEDRIFELSNDPRQRDTNNVALVTANSRHDVIWLVDDAGDFGRYVPYATYAARPVVGSEGLRPLAWHWTYERHGAPQLNQRFRRNLDRGMSPEDWAAWVAVRSVIEGVSRTGSVDVKEVAGYVRSDALSLDLYKGVSGSFRSWNGQLRQPIILATHNAVISRAPLDGFEHQIDTLDSLGVDEAESTCNP